MIFHDVTATVGRTPMVELGRVARGLPGRVVAKLEMRNPCGSVKDRVGVALIEDAERQGLLRPGMTLVEATNSGSGGASVCMGGTGFTVVIAAHYTQGLFACHGGRSGGNGDRFIFDSRTCPPTEWVAFEHRKHKSVPISHNLVSRSA